MRNHRAAPALSALLAAFALVLAGCPPRMGDAEKLVRDGNRYFESENYEDAIEAYTKALELKPGEPGILVNRGNARMMHGDTEGAALDFEAAIEADPRFANSYANRGILRDRMGDTAGATADYRKALELNPKLGEKPGILKRILYNPPTETIKDRLEFLEAVEKQSAGE